MEELTRWHLGDEVRACAVNGDGGAGALLLRLLRRAEEAKEKQKQKCGAGRLLVACWGFLGHVAA